MTCRSDPETATFLSECPDDDHGEHDWVTEDVSIDWPPIIETTCYNCGALLEQDED